MQKWYSDKRWKEIEAQIKRNTEAVLKFLADEMEKKGGVKMDYSVNGIDGTISTSDPTAIAKELGTPTQPANPFIRSTILAEKNAVVEILTKP